MHCELSDTKDVCAGYVLAIVGLKQARCRGGSSSAGTPPTVVVCGERKCGPSGRRIDTTVMRVEVVDPPHTGLGDRCSIGAKTRVHPVDNTISTEASRSASVGSRLRTSLPTWVYGPKARQSIEGITILGTSKRIAAGRPGPSNGETSAGTPDDPIVGLHYRLLAYVCGPNCIQPSPTTEPITFTKVMELRPERCRFAVAQMIPLKIKGTPNTDNLPHGPFVAWDLHDDLLVRGKRMAPSGLLMPPPPAHMGTSEDAVVMLAMVHYGRA